MLKLVKKFWNDEQGMELSEYAIMVGLIAVLVLAVVKLIGTDINLIFQKLETALAAAAA